MRNLFSARDVAFYSLYSILSSLVFETPVLFLFLARKGLPYSQITWLFSFFALAVFAFEYATGVLADKYTRKFTLVFSTVSLIAGELAFIVGSNPLHFAGAFALIALSTASKSGADTAYLYDRLADLGRQDDFDAILSSLGSLVLLVSIAATVAGPLLTRSGMSLPFWATIVFSLLSILALLNLSEARAHQTTPARLIIAKSVRIAVQNRAVMGYIVLSIFMFPCFHILYWLLQPTLEAGHVPVESFGLLYALLTVFQSAGTRMTGWLTRKHSADRVLVAASFSILAGFLLMSLQVGWIVYLVPALMGTAFGVYYTTNSIVVNRSIESDIRASLISLQHALTKVAQVILFGLIGLVINAVPVQSVLLAVSALLFLCVGASALAFRNHLDLLPGHPDLQPR